MHGGLLRGCKNDNRNIRDQRVSIRRGAHYDHYVLPALNQAFRCCNQQIVTRQDYKQDGRVRLIVKETRKFEHETNIC